MSNETQVFLTNTNVIHKCTWSLSMRWLTQTTLFTFRESVTYKIRKTQRSSDDEKTRKIRNLRHLTFQVSVTSIFFYILLRIA